MSINAENRDVHSCRRQQRVHTVQKYKLHITWRGAETAVAPWCKMINNVLMCILKLSNDPVFVCYIKSLLS